VLATTICLLALAGCRICQSPFDYCSAVAGPGGSAFCDFGARYNSVLCPPAGCPPSGGNGPTLAHSAAAPAATDADDPQLDTVAQQEDDPQPGADEDESVADMAEDDADSQRR
jgi:hypothetical protein